VCNVIKYILILILFTAGGARSQDSIHILKNMNYRLADSLALNFPKKKYKSFTEVAGPLCEPLKTEHEKFRAIFRWITDNIEYNKSATNVADADKIVRKNKAVCQGFSSLLKEMCNSVNIECDTISGYTKTEVRDIGKKLKKTDHAWNAVKLYGKWYLVDVTWATSKYNVVTHKFEKSFDEHYFICYPDKFILDHFPKTKQWQLLPKEVKAKQFINWPLFYADYFHLDFQGISMNKGKFKMKINKPYTVTFTSGTEITEASLQLNADRYNKPLPLKKTANPGEYSFDFTIEKEDDYDLTLYFNGLVVAEYLVKAK
jgi:hypothetical protein